MICAHCSMLFSYEPPLRRMEECSGCGKSLKSCLNCESFDEKSSQQCRESQADLVRDKTESNFCEWFVGSTVLKRKRIKEDKKNLEDLEDLFSKAKQNNKDLQEKITLDSLFKK